MELDARELFLYCDDESVCKRLKESGFPLAVFAGEDFRKCFQQPDEVQDAPVFLFSGHWGENDRPVRRVTRMLSRSHSAVRFQRINVSQFSAAPRADVRRAVEEASTIELGACAAFSARQLVRTQLQAVEWAVEGVVPDVGLVLFSGRPKCGKSWWALQIALALAKGALLAGRFRTTKSKVLAYCLEDGPRRLQDRLGALGFTGNNGDEEIVFKCGLPNMDGWDNALITTIRADVEHFKPRVVLIDPLVAVKGDVERHDLFRGEYQQLRSLRDLAEELGIAVVVLHHSRKPISGGSNDPIDMALGTTGLTAAADSVLALTGTPKGAVLHVIPRDAERLDLECRFDQDKGGWEILGTVEEIRRKRRDSENETGRLSGKKEAILKLIATTALTPGLISDKLGIKRGTVGRELKELHDAGLIIKADGGYLRKPTEPPPEPPIPARLPSA